MTIRYSDLLRAVRFADQIPVEANLTLPVQTVPGAHTAFCTMGTGSASWGYSGRSVALTTHPRLVLSIKKGWSYTSTSRLDLHGLFYT
jgi:hypothetical protein